jgi:hypothetical protein
MTAPETLRVIDALDTLYPPTNPAVLLAAARDAYLSGVRHRELVRLLTWTLVVIARNVPSELTEGQLQAIVALEFAPTLKEDR